MTRHGSGYHLTTFKEIETGQVEVSALEFRLRLAHSLEGLPKVSFQVLDVLDADTQTDKSGVGTRIGGNALLDERLDATKTSRRLPEAE